MLNLELSTRSVSNSEHVIGVKKSLEDATLLRIIFLSIFKFYNISNILVNSIDRITRLRNKIYLYNPIIKISRELPENNLITYLHKNLIFSRVCVLWEICNVTYEVSLFWWRITKVDRFAYSNVILKKLSVRRARSSKFHRSRMCVCCNECCLYFYFIFYSNKCDVYASTRIRRRRVTLF